MFKAVPYEPNDGFPIVFVANFSSRSLLVFVVYQVQCWHLEQMVSDVLSQAER